MRPTFLACLAFILMATASFAVGEALIPVYPGAKLEIEEGADPQCCDFTTADPYSKVLSFYEKSLKVPPLTMEEAAKKYAALSGKMRQLKRQMPAGVEYRVFALPFQEGAGKEAPPLFEVLSAGGAVNFNIPGQSLSGSDLGFLREFKQRTGTFTETEKMDEQNRRREEEGAAEEAAAAKREEALWTSVFSANGFPVYSAWKYQGSTGPYCTSGGEGETRAPCTMATFTSPDSPAKVGKFYGGGNVVKNCVRAVLAENPGDDGKPVGTAINVEYDSKCRGAEKFRADLFGDH